MQDTQPQLQGDASRLPVDPLLLQSPFREQQVLFVAVHHDDAALLADEENLWLRFLLTFDWKAHVTTAARYYQALWEWNVAAAKRRQEPAAEVQLVWSENEDEASLRLMAERPTGGNTEAPIVHPTPQPPEQTPTVIAERLEPGVVPSRIAGREPKCFFAMLVAFLALHVMGREGSAEEVDHLLRMSPPFARACGFTIPAPDGEYRQSDIPSLRKLEQFDQIMSDRGLWAEVKVRIVRENLASGVVPLANQKLAHDTTHFIAYSAMEVLEVPPPATGENPLDQTAQRQEMGTQAGPGPEQAPSQTDAQEQTSEQKPKKPKRKSQSRTVKACRCPEPEICPHPFVQSDPGAGTVVKGSQAGGKRKYWAHKAAVFTITPFGTPLDAVAMTDAASHDGTSLEPHLERLIELYPEIREEIEEILADTAYDDAATKRRILEKYGIRIRTNVNPRSRKPQTKELARGMKSLSPVGTLTCQADREMTYVGMRFKAEQFIYGPPGQAKGAIACLDCPLRQSCCNEDNQGGRYVAIPFTKLPHISTDDPPMAKRFKAAMRLRSVIERSIKRIKLDFGDDHLTRRGNHAFQAHLDRSLAALHLVLRLQ